MYIVTSGMNPNEDHIEHHGVLGMKWGVHRYRDKSGNITKRGKKRFEKVASDSRLGLKEAKKAINIHALDNTYKSRLANAYEWKAGRAEKRGDTETAKKYRELKKDAINDITNNSKTIDQIRKGTLKAGRDFVTQSDMNFYFLYNNSKGTVVYKDPKRKNVTATTSELYVIPVG